MVGILYRQFSTFLSRYDVLQPVPVVRRVQVGRTVLRALSHSASIILRLVSTTLALWLCLHALESSGLFARLPKDEGEGVATHSYNTFLCDVRGAGNMPVDTNVFESDEYGESLVHQTHHPTINEATSVEQTPELGDPELCPNATAVTPIYSHGRRFMICEKGAMHLESESDPGLSEEELQLCGCKRSTSKLTNIAHSDPNVNKTDPYRTNQAFANSEVPQRGVREHRSRKVHFESPLLSATSEFSGLKSPCVLVPDVFSSCDSGRTTASTELRYHYAPSNSTGFPATAAQAVKRTPLDELIPKGQKSTDEKEKSSEYGHSFPSPVSPSSSHSGNPGQNAMNSTDNGELESLDSLDPLFSPPLHSSERGLDYESDAGSGITKDSPTARSPGVSYLTRLTHKAKSLHRLASQHEKDAEQLRLRAHCTTFLAHNRQYNTYSSAGLAQLDLHQLPVDEALVFMRLHLSKCRRRGVTMTRIVTGRGLHSTDGKPRIKPMVEEELKFHTDLRTWQLNPGSVGVTFLRDKTMAEKVSSY